jgi:hypothetical protein
MMRAQIFAQAWPIDNGTAQLDISFHQYRHPLTIASGQIGVVIDSYH